MNLAPNEARTRNIGFVDARRLLRVCGMPSVDPARFCSKRSSRTDHTKLMLELKDIRFPFHAIWST